MLGRGGGVRLCRLLFRREHFVLILGKAKGKEMEVDGGRWWYM